MPVGAHEDTAGGLHLPQRGPLAVRVGHAFPASDDMDTDGYSRACGDFRCRLRPCLAAHPGEQGEAQVVGEVERGDRDADLDRKSTRLNSSHVSISYAVFCLKKKKKT